MSPEAGKLLLERIVPIISSMVPVKVRTVGSEDYQELIQDCTVSAANMIHAAESAGKRLIPQSIAYYAIQRAKTGRRSMYAGRADAMAPSTSLDGNAYVESMDQPLHDELSEDGNFTLHDVLATPSDDTAHRAGRSCDWSEFTRHCDDREQAILRAIAEGRKLNKLARRLKVSAPRVSQMQKQIGARLHELWGPEALLNATAEPKWHLGMRAHHERRQAKYERWRANA